MTLLEKINKLNYVNLINKLKDILKGLNDKPSGGYEPPYKVYTALLTQSGTDAPVATVLENTLGGDIVWSRTGQGGYLGTPSITIDREKTGIILGLLDLSSSARGVVYTDLDSDFISLFTYDNSLSVSDGALFKTLIEIRVYN